MKEIEFARRGDANEIRNRLDDFTADDDDRRSKTLKLEERVPDSMVQRVREEAADSRQAEADKAGQTELTDRERKEIDFAREGVNVPFARSIKGIAQNEGVTDWLQFADLELTVDENRSVLNQASNEERNRSGLGKSERKDQIDRQADTKRQRRKQAEQAKQPAFGGDSEAIEFLQEEQRFEDDLFDISLRGDGPSGRDIERLQDAHNDRSERAQRVDERRSAEVTRNPLVWSQNKDTMDIPGIDTVDPQELHDQRSKEARKQDLREKAPIADSREQWATAPDQYDWQGVDTPTGPSMDQLKDRAETLQWTKVDAVGRGNEDAQRAAVRGKASSFDVSLGPNEALGDMGTESMNPSSGTNPDRFASGFDADQAFFEAEEDRASDDPLDGLEFTDDRDEQGSMLDFGMETDATQHRESREAEAQASEFGIDDRSDDVFGESMDEGDQSGLEGFGGGARENKPFDEY